LGPKGLPSTQFSLIARALFLCFAADNRTLSISWVEDLGEKTVLAFLRHTELTLGNKVTTRNLRLAGIRSLFGFLARELPPQLDLCQRVKEIPAKRTEHKNG
jgi:hypothetical protein